MVAQATLNRLVLVRLRHDPPYSLKGITMIRDSYLNVTIDYIAEWIRDRVEKAHCKTAVVGVSGGADSALVAILCKRVLPDTVGVLMPCHSSKVSLERGKELCQKFDIKNLTIDLSTAHDSMIKSIKESSLLNADDKMAQAALRSCLRAPALDAVAKIANALIIGTGNRDEDELARYYQKRGDGAVDCSPTAKLHKSETYQLLEHLGCPRSIIEAVPSADLWGPDAGQEDEKEMGITYPEMEWAIDQNDRYRLISEDSPWMSADVILGYSDRQRFVITKLRAMDRASRHKALPPPVLEIRSECPHAFYKAN